MSDDTPDRNDAGSEPARRVTMMEVARAARVSQSSVSLVLNGMTGARISESTRQRVIAAARELGYMLPYFRRSEEFGIRSNGLAVDMSAVRGRKRKMVSGLIDVHVDNFHKSGA